MAQAKVNRELANLEADLNRTYMSKGYIAQSKLKINSAIHGTEENNVLTSETSDDNEEALAGAATTLNLLFSHIDNSVS